MTEMEIREFDRPEGWLNENGLVEKINCYLVQRGMLNIIY